MSTTRTYYDKPTPALGYDAPEWLFPAETDSAKSNGVYEERGWLNMGDEQPDVLRSGNITIKIMEIQKKLYFRWFAMDSYSPTSKFRT